MTYTKEEVLQYVAEEDVKFIRMTFTDVFGKPKNISVMPHELERVFRDGIAFDGSAVAGFTDGVRSDLLLHPDPATLAPLPWRPDHGRVVRMFCRVTHPDGTPAAADTRAMLAEAVSEAEAEGVSFSFGPEAEFYLFRRDEDGEPTTIPYDHAGYMDMAPEDKGENVRREVCLTLEAMGILPESSHHEEGPGQNEIDFRYSDPLSAADHAVTFRTAVSAVADRMGLYADFSPKPLADLPGSGMHINFSARAEGRDVMPAVIAGILDHIGEITLFLNTGAASYRRLGSMKAPKYIACACENRTALIRIPAATGDYRRAELRSPDPTCNPYLAFALLIHAGLDGIRRSLTLPPYADTDFTAAPPDILSAYRTLPASHAEAARTATESPFVREHVPPDVLRLYAERSL